jgi:copper chaperone CopZ
VPGSGSAFSNTDPYPGEPNQYRSENCIIIVRVSPVSVVQGMTCSSCVNLIESSLSRLAGVHEVSVALTTERGRVRFDRALLGPRDILAAVNSLGFQVWFGLYSLSFICSTLSTVVSALNERSSDPGTYSLPSTVSDFRFGLVSTV